MTMTHEAEIAQILGEVRRIEIQSRRLVYDVMAGGYRSAFRGAGIEFDEVREYVDGDDPRSVDWNVTARVGRPFVKKYVDERELTVLFLVDLSPSMDGGFGSYSQRQIAARLMACLALSAVRNRDHAGMGGLSDHIETFIPPRKGLPHALRMVRDILAKRPSTRKTDLKQGLNTVTRALRKRSVLFLISDFLADGYADALAPCARRHDLIGLRLLAPEQQLPTLPIVRSRSLEGGVEQTLDWSYAPLRDLYEENRKRFLLETRRKFTEAGADLVDITVPRTPDPIALLKPLLSFFRMRELRGAKR
jgi:uncharacterized protein (DUF58 family)